MCNKMSLFDKIVRFLFVLVIVSAVWFIQIARDPQSYGLEHEWWSEYQSLAKKVCLTMTYLAWGYVIHEEF